MGGIEVILLDTHAWVWWIASPEKLSRHAAERIEKAQTIGVAAISCWELAMLVARGRLGLAFDVEEWIEKSLRQPRARLLDLSPKISVLATRLEGTPPRDPVDRLLIATAKIHGIPMITKDAEITGYPYVSTVW